MEKHSQARRPVSVSLRALGCLAVAVAILLPACGPPAQGEEAPARVGDSAGRVGGQQGGTPKQGGAVDSKVDWSEVERLISEQKMEAAAEKAEAIRRRAQEAGDEKEWTRALIKEVQLRMALHGYETSVRFLREQPWPEAALERSILELFYAQSLRTYLQVYSWEIEQREKVETADVVDLKAWTKEQILGEAVEAYARLWQDRQEWGAESLGTLAEYFQQNDYPPRIRGTFRDAVTYLWVELLADTSGWRPEQSSRLYQLDLEKLLGQVALTDDDLVDSSVHPLHKIAFVLGDLEGWHGDRRPEAAFEAHLERLRQLQNHFSRPAQREILGSDLDRALEALGRSYPWWSVGMALKAEMVRDGGGADALVKALAIALEGAEPHPESVGGRRCQYLAAAITAPSYTLSSMASDGPGRRSVLVQHKNLDGLHFRAYRVDLLRQIAAAKDYNLLPAYRQVQEIVQRQKPAAAWEVNVPATPDYRLHRTFVTPPAGVLEDPGLYLVVASVREDFSDANNRLAAVNLLVSEMVLVSRQQAEQLEVQILEGASGDPLAGVEVDLYRHDWQQGHRIVRSGKTDAAGRLSFSIDDQRQSFFLVARRGQDVALDPSFLRGQKEPANPERDLALLYTDRSVYRPRQTIFWKAVAYRGKQEEGKFHTLPKASLTVDLLDANRQVVFTEEATTNAFGSASGEFEIPAGRLLGSWEIRTSLGGSTEVQVEEYKRPTFEVEIADGKEPLRLNREASLEGTARYYFGLPVVGGKVEWRVARVPVYPRWGWWWRPPTPSEEVIASGTASMADDGTFPVRFVPEADEEDADKGISYRYRLTAEVTDDGGETRSASKTFRLGFVAVEATLDSDVAFFVAGEGGELQARRQNLDGQPRAGVGRWRLLRLEQPAKALLPAEQPRQQGEIGEDAEQQDGEAGAVLQTPGDRLRSRWEVSRSVEQLLAAWQEGADVAEAQVEHGEDGLATIALQDLAPGAYRLRYTTEDSFGAPFETFRDIIVASEGRTPLALPLVLLAERTSVPAGETLRVLVHSGLEEQGMVLEIFHGSQRLERRRVRSGDGLQLVEVPVKSEFRGGLSMRLTALRDYQLMEAQQQVFVPWDDRRLQIELATFRDLLRPGQRETWTVRLRGADEEVLAAGAAELLAYMYDRSLDLFAPHQPMDPIQLYPTFQGLPLLRSSLGLGREVWSQNRDWAGLPGYPNLQPDRLKFYEGYGIGGPGGRGGRGMVRSRGIPAPMAMQSMAMMDASAPTEAAEGVMAKVATAFEAEASPVENKAAPEAPSGEGLRSDFSETAFWEPHLLTDEDGAVTFEFQVPDSVTEWNVWVLGVTRDLRAGLINRKARTVKDLLVRPYLPRFLREGDTAELRVVVNNAGEENLEGTLDFRIEDPETGESLLDAFGLSDSEATGSAFELPAGGGGATVTFPIRVPPRVGTVAFRVVGKAGSLSDGELRPLPVLPGRFHLAQSRFAALREGESKELHFADLAADGDPTRIDEQMVVTIDGQLFYSVLSALPYLIDYPYECTEQTLNRFLSTGIVSSLFDQYPAVAAMAKTFAQRDTRLETWDDADPNRRMALEETPWLRQAQGGSEPAADLIKVLDPEVAKAQQRASLAKLEKAQTSIGGFPWWPGGPPSPYMTLYLLQGFSRALEFDVEVPRPMVERAWSYLHVHYVDAMVRDMVKEDCCWEMVTFLGYVLSSYPEDWTGGVFTADERKIMLDFSFRHWRRHSPRLKGYLALTLERSGRSEDARLVFDSVMDSAKTTDDEGTFWQPEDRAWLWYNDTIEGHALALRAMTELRPDDRRRHGLVHWLMLNKKLNHWKSTRATAEVLYAMTHYLQAEGALAVEEKAIVTAGEFSRTFVFRPDAYTGRKNQLVIPGPEVDTAVATVTVEKQGKGLLFASATWHFSTEQLPEEERGDFLGVSRRYFKRLRTGDGWALQPLSEGEPVAVGDQVEVQISLRSKQSLEYVHLRDPRPAGFEPESTASGYHWDLGIGWYEEVRDSGSNFFFDWLPGGEYTFKVRLRAAVAGTFKAAPATVQPMYAPEFAAYSSGATVQIQP